MDHRPNTLVHRHQYTVYLKVAKRVDPKSSQYKKKIITMGSEGCEIILLCYIVYTNIYICEIMLYTVNLYNVLCQLHLSKAGKTHLQFILYQLYVNKAAQKVKARKGQVYIWDDIYLPL